MRWNGAELDWLIVLAFGGIALWSLLAGPVTRWRFERFAKGAVWTTARVVSKETRTIARFSRSRRDPVTLYFADLQFTTEDGQQVDIRRKVTQGVSVGAELPVAYRAENPSGARIDRAPSTSAGLFETGGVTGFVIYAGIGFGILWGIGAIELG